MVNIKRGFAFLIVVVVISNSALKGAQSGSSTNQGSDVLVPKIGHSLFGIFKSATKVDVIITLDSGPQLTVPWNEITELQVNHRVALESTTALAAMGGSKSFDMEKVSIRPDQENLNIVGNVGSLVLPKASLISVSTSISSDSADGTKKPTWTISITPKASLATGTQTQQTWGGQLNTRREQEHAAPNWHHQMTNLTLDANNVLTEQVGSPSIRTHEYDGLLSHAVYLTKRLYVHALGDGYHNSSLNLYLEQAYGGGLGGKVTATDRNVLELTGDLLFIGEHFYGSVPSVSFPGAGLTERYSLKIADLKGGPLELVESGTYLPAFGQKKAWQTRGIAEVIIPLNKSFSGNLSFGDDYMENAPNARKNYSTSSVGITYTFPAPQ